MGTESRENSSTPYVGVGQRGMWPWINQVLQAGEYDLIAEWLLTVEEMLGADTPARAITTAVVALCRVCQEQQRESEATWAAYQRHVWQEKMLTEGLSGLLEALLALPLDGDDAYQGGRHLQEIRPFILDSSGRRPPGLWQKLQNMVNRLAGSEPDLPSEQPALRPEREMAVPFILPPSPEIKEPQHEQNLDDSTGDQSANFSSADRALLHDIVDLLQSQNQLLLAASSTDGAAAPDPPQAPNGSQPPTVETPVPPAEESAPAPYRAMSDDLPRKPGIPCLTVYTLGAFRVYQDDQLIDDITSSKSWSIFKYLLVNRTKPVAKEVLMDMFWPEAAPDAARNNLNVAIYHLRKTLRDGYHDFSHILYQDDHYALNSEMVVWVDADDFAEKYRQAQSCEGDGRYQQAIQLYHAAELVYQGEFLAEDRYEDWPIFLRQRYQSLYLQVLQRLGAHYYAVEEYNLCIRFCRLILIVDPCDEEAHQQIMRCYYYLGQHYLALRQYH
ncbi:MAG: winged helix-turn-helix domain-containing protein, partial [Anaerolineales bacterium]|nr:winged helix-turn-helix domain-containing protein [Anaerolineales bacterium]